MPLYFFRIRNGRYSGASSQGTEFADRDAAWHELTSVCANIVGGISRKLKLDSEWEMELLDESKQPVFRIRLVAESMDRTRSNESFPRPRAGADNYSRRENPSR